jgi:hypothetical protein
MIFGLNSPSFVQNQRKILNLGHRSTAWREIFAKIKWVGRGSSFAKIEWVRGKETDIAGSVFKVHFVFLMTLLTRDLSGDGICEWIS